MTFPARLRLTLAASLALPVVACLVAPLVGATRIDLARALDTRLPFETNVDAQVFFVARLPRALGGALVGASLAAAGVVLQALLRNPLATPYTLGVSAGAALGAMLAITFGAAVSVAGVTTVPLASLAGAFGAVAVVYALAASRHRGLSTEVLLLAGVTLNAFFSALILFVQYFADFAETARTLRWLMGDLDIGSYASLGSALPLAVAAFAMFAWLPRRLNLLAAGPESAATRGVDVARTQRIAFFSASLATAAAVAVAGPIGFVGIVVPHLVRLVVGADHRLVLPASAGVGAAFLVACDTVARTALAPIELPVGIVTATIGGPFFLWLLLRRRPGLLVVLACVAAGVNCGRTPEPTPPATGTGAPSRIVSVVPAATEMLFAMGAGPQVVAVGSHDTWPPEVSTRARVGALLDPDVERIITLRPDLVVIYASQETLTTSLEKARVPYWTYRHGDLTALLSTMRELGARVGHAGDADRLAAEIAARIDAVRTRVAGKPRPRTLLVFSRDALALRQVYASGGIGFLHDMLTAAGGDNVFADVPRQSVQASTEAILTRAPDVILEIRASMDDAVVERERAVWNLLSSVPAVRTGRVIVLRSGALVVPGPRVAEGTEMMADALHGGERQ